MEVEEALDLFRIAELWNKSLLEELSSKRAEKELHKLVGRLVKLDLKELARITNGNENEIHSLELLQQAVESNQHVFQLLKDVCKNHNQTQMECLASGQKYFDIVASTRAILLISLQRINYFGQTKFLLDTILPQESIAFYFEFLLERYCEKDIVEFLNACQNDWIQDVQSKLLEFLDQERWTKFYCQFCQNDLDGLKELVKFTERKLPFQFQQPLFRRSVMDTLSFKYNKTHQCLDIIRLLPDFTEDDLAWLDHRVFHIQSSINNEVKNELKCLIKRKQEFYGDEISHLTLDVLCREVSAKEFSTTAGLTPLVVAFQKRFREQDNIDVHPALMNMNKLLRAYEPHLKAQIKLLWEDDLLNYNGMLGLFLDQIPVSCVSDLASLCPCCEKSFAECLKDFEGIGELIALTTKNEKKLKECLVLVNLPTLEKEWGLEGDEPILVESEEIIDDGTELGFFSDDDLYDNSL